MNKRSVLAQFRICWGLNPIFPLFPYSQFNVQSKAFLTFILMCKNYSRIYFIVVTVFLFAIIICTKTSHQLEYQALFHGFNSELDNSSEEL